MISGGCHCGAIRYEVDGEPVHHALCHCTDCRRCSGAPVVGWAMFPAEAVTVTEGEPVTYQSSENASRLFCIQCGTGLFYINPVVLPGMIDIQSATFDDPDALPAQAQIQTADRISWMEKAHELPAFARYPSPE